MGTGTIKIEAKIVAEWFVLGKQLNDIRELLQLPDSFAVISTVIRDDGVVIITVNSELIPGNDLSELVAEFSGNGGSWADQESYRLASLKAIVRII